MIAAEPIKNPSKSYIAPALEKGFDIIELLADTDGGLTASQIARRLGRSMNEIYRILLVMERRGWLYKEAGADRYSVTYRILDIMYRATLTQPLTSAAAPHMQALALATNQSCHLAIRSGMNGLVVLRQENGGPSGFAMQFGAMIELATSCSGHVLLAYADEDRLDGILDKLPDLDPASLDQLRKRLATVRKRGYEKQPSARVSGIIDVSYPIFDFNGRISAALTIPFLTRLDGSTLDIEETRIQLGEAARRISHEVGWTG